MEFQPSAQATASERILAAVLAAAAMFVVGYTATRVYLNQPGDSSTQAPASVIPHQAELWSALGR